MTGNLFKFQAERDVSFDHGVNNSITEDFFFALKATVKGYSFGWIEGEMIEESTLTFMDFLKQRKRWMWGNCLVIHQSRQIPLKYRILISCFIYSKAFGCLQVITGYLNIFYDFPTMDVIYGMLSAIAFYTYYIGAVKAFSLSDYGTLESVIGVIATTCLVPVFLATEAIVSTFAFLSNDNAFYVVKKNEF